LSCAADPIDVLQVLELSDHMAGVSMEAGLCTSRKDMEETDMAYRIDKKIQLSAPTKQLFPDSLFPVDFSLMTTVRAKKDTQFFLLSVYDEQGVQQLGLEVGRSPVFLYEDHQGQPSPELYPIFKKINLADGKWHRIAYSVEGKSVTLYLDCEKVQTLELLRGDNPLVSTEGVIVFGTRLLDEEVFELRTNKAKQCRHKQLHRVALGIIKRTVNNTTEKSIYSVCKWSKIREVRQ
uniref:Thrombospondin-like N-terminal domain-containing protein n=1 Tax=Oncorhynchus mykiss TaxID=8022 RepID=A0A8C7U6T5_ONCMY